MKRLVFFSLVLGWMLFGGARVGRTDSSSELTLEDKYPKCYKKTVCDSRCNPKIDCWKIANPMFIADFSQGPKTATYKQQLLLCRYRKKEERNDYICDAPSIAETGEKTSIHVMPAYYKDASLPLEQQVLGCSIDIFNMSDFRISNRGEHYGDCACKDEQPCS